MRFEERELKPCAEPFPPENLKIGETYFAVLFLDDDGVVPVLEPLVFIGRKLVVNGITGYMRPARSCPFTPKATIPLSLRPFVEDVPTLLYSF